MGELTPCFDPKKEPIAESGAEIPNQRIMISNIVPSKNLQYSKASERAKLHLPKGTAPDEPADRRKRLRRNTTAKTKLVAL